MGAVNFFQNLQNNIEHRLSFVEYLVVPEAQHPISLLFDSMVATLIIVAAFLVLSAIKFYHQLRFKAREIRNIAAERYLTPEAVAA